MNKKYTFPAWDENRQFTGRSGQSLNLELETFSKQVGFWDQDEFDKILQSNEDKDLQKTTTAFSIVKNSSGKFVPVVCIEEATDQDLDGKEGVVKDFTFTFARINVATAIAEGITDLGKASEYAEIEGKRLQAERLPKLKVHRF